MTHTQNLTGSPEIPQKWVAGLDDLYHFLLPTDQESLNRRLPQTRYSQIGYGTRLQTDGKVLYIRHYFRIPLRKSKKVQHYG